jgi:ribonuclease R
MHTAANGTPQQHLLAQHGIRTMAKAIYTSENIGHSGLGFELYCHFTSPIRRYPDVMVHRILQQVLDGKHLPDKKMEIKCKHSSERERAAMECERAANKYKQVEYMMQFLGEDFDAVITGVSSFGFWAETVTHKCEGLVSMKDLNYYDDFRLIESDYLLAGLRTGRKFRIGDLVRIKVVAANLEKRQLDYEWQMQKSVTMEEVTAVPQKQTRNAAARPPVEKVKTASAKRSKSPAAKSAKSKADSQPPSKRKRKSGSKDM